MEFERFGSGRESLRYAFVSEGVVLRTRMASVRGDENTAKLVRLLLSSEPLRCSPEEIEGVVLLAKQLYGVGVGESEWSNSWQQTIEEFGDG